MTNKISFVTKITLIWPRNIPNYIRNDNIVVLNDSLPFTNCRSLVCVRRKWRNIIDLKLDYWSQMFSVHLICSLYEVFKQALLNPLFAYFFLILNSVSVVVLFLSDFIKIITLNAFCLISDILFAALFISLVLYCYLNKDRCVLCFTW